MIFKCINCENEIKLKSVIQQIKYYQGNQLARFYSMSFCCIECLMEYQSLLKEAQEFLENFDSSVAI